jgi:hypothetical protein
LPYLRAVGRRNFSIRIDFIAPLPDYFGVMLAAILPITTAAHPVRQVPKGANPPIPATRLFDTGTFSRYFRFMALYSTGYPPMLSHFSFLLSHAPDASPPTTPATVPSAIDTQSHPGNY